MIILLENLPKQRKLKLGFFKKTTEIKMPPQVLLFLHRKVQDAEKYEKQFF